MAAESPRQLAGMLGMNLSVSNPALHVFELPQALWILPSTMIITLVCCRGVSPTWQP